ncbi:MAG: response regulator [Polyangiales bacterium]|nr:response regulator [Myxococcales bacterium]
MHDSRTILLVDDDRDVRETLAEILEDEGFHTHQASSGRAALDWILAADPKPALVVLDLMMPDMDGYQFVEERDRRPELRMVPVIVLTAHDVTGSSPLPAAEAWFAKPLDMERFLEAVNGFVAADAP